MQYPHIPAQIEEDPSRLYERALVFLRRYWGHADFRPGQSGFQGVEMPAGFMINYHMYSNYWPLAALGRYRRFVRGEPPVYRPGATDRRKLALAETSG